MRRALARLGPIVLAVACVLSTSCATSALDGPQLRRPPPGLGYDGTCSRSGPGQEWATLEVVRARCWSERREGGAWLTITELGGALRLDQLEAQLDATARRAHDGSETPVPFETRIDGRPAWAWRTRSEAPARAQSGAAVVYGDATWVVTLSSRPAAGEDLVATERRLAEAVSSFSRDPSALADVAVPAALVAFAGLAAWSWWRRRVAPRPEDRPDAAARPF